MRCVLLVQQFQISNDNIIFLIGTVLIRFKLNIGDPKKEKESVNYFKQLLENSSLNLIDLHGNSLSIPPHYLEDLHDGIYYLHIKAYL